MTKTFSIKRIPTAFWIILLILMQISWIYRVPDLYAACQATNIVRVKDGYSVNVRKDSNESAAYASNALNFQSGEKLSDKNFGDWYHLCDPDGWIKVRWNNTLIVVVTPIVVNTNTPTPTRLIPAQTNVAAQLTQIAKTPMPNNVRIIVLEGENGVSDVYGVCIKACELHIDLKELP